MGIMNPGRISFWPASIIRVLGPAKAANFGSRADGGNAVSTMANAPAIAGSDPWCGWRR